MTYDDITKTDIASTYLVLETIRDDYLDDPYNEVLNGVHQHVQDLENQIDRNGLWGTSFEPTDNHVITTTHGQTWIVDVLHDGEARLESDAMDLVEAQVQYDNEDPRLTYRGTVTEFINDHGPNGMILIS